MNNEIRVGETATDRKGRKCKVLAIEGGYAMCRYHSAPSQKHPVRAVPIDNLTPFRLYVMGCEFPVEKGTVLVMGLKLEINDLERMLHFAKESLK